MMTEIETVEDFVKQHIIVNSFPKTDLAQLEKRVNLLREAGIGTYAKAHRELMLQRVIAKLGKHLLLQPPKFEGKYFSQRSFPQISEDFTADAYTIREKRVIDKKTWHTTYSHVEGLYLFEIETEEYIADIPDNILEATVEAKKMGLHPYVWFATTPQKYHEYARVLHDPAMVGYPIIKEEDDHNYEKMSTEFAVLLGIWGKDITDINKALEK